MLGKVRQSYSLTAPKMLSGFFLRGWKHEENNGKKEYVNKLQDFY
jgi:hypothetical protein